MIVLLDYGHGGVIDGVYQTPNAKQYTFTDHDDHIVYEGVLNRQIACRLIKKLREARIPVVDVVAREISPVKNWTDLEQRDVSLRDRIRFANDYARQQHTIYVSIHSNAFAKNIIGDSTKASGSSFYVYPASLSAKV